MRIESTTKATIKIDLDMFGKYTIDEKTITLELPNLPNIVLVSHLFFDEDYFPKKYLIAMAKEIINRGLAVTDDINSLLFLWLRFNTCESGSLIFNHLMKTEKSFFYKSAIDNYIFSRLEKDSTFNEIIKRTIIYRIEVNKDEYTFCLSLLNELILKNSNDTIKEYLRGLKNEIFYLNI